MMFEIDRELMKKGLEEALKHKLNLIKEDRMRTSYLPCQFSGYEIEYAALRETAINAGVNMGFFDLKFADITGEAVNLAIRARALALKEGIPA